MAMSPERVALKTFLMRERVVTRHWKSLQDGKLKTYRGLICELCGKAYQEGRTGKLFVPGLDMHEVWITRGNVRGVDRLVKAVTESKYNCVLICNRCNVNVADTKWASDLLGAGLVLRYGTEPIIAWMEGIGMKTIRPYILHVERVRDELVDIPYTTPEEVMKAYREEVMAKKQPGQLRAEL